jgi:hypothetical protein
LNTIREARLRPEFEALYPDLEPSVWIPARVLMEFVLERGLYQRRTGSPTHARPLIEAHFEFRGGAPGSGHVGRATPSRHGD